MGPELNTYPNLTLSKNKRYIIIKEMVSGPDAIREKPPIMEKEEKGRESELSAHKFKNKIC